MIIDKIEFTKRNIKRAGNHMTNIMTQARTHQKLGSEEAFSLFNTYGITLDIILLIAHSHGVNVDERGFEILLEKQKEELKSLRRC